MIQVEIPEQMATSSLPEGVNRRLERLLDKQDEGTPLTPDEQKEAEGLVDLAEMLSLIRLQANRPS